MRTTFLLLSLALLAGCSDEELGGTTTEIPDDTGATSTEGGSYSTDDASWTGSSSGSGDTDDGSGGSDTDSSGNNGGSTVIPWYADCDRDDYGDDDVYINSATEPNYAACGDDGADIISWTTVAGDCKDDNAAVHPGAVDNDVDGWDQDCNGVDGTTSSLSTWWRDADGDGYGNPDSSTSAMTQPTGYVNNSSDCLDTNEDVNPAGSESMTADGLDNDCDGTIDEGTTSGGGSTATGVEVCARNSSSVAKAEVMIHNDTTGDLSLWGGLADWSTAGNTEVYSDYNSAEPDDLSEAFVVTGVGTETCWTYPSASPRDEIEVQAYVRLNTGSYTWGANAVYFSQYFTVTCDGDVATMRGNDYYCQVSE